MPQAPDKQMHLYDGEIEVDFYETFHRYMVGPVGEKKARKSGVTTYTGIIDKSRPLMIWACNEMEKSLIQTLESGYAIAEGHIAEAKKAHQVRSDEAKSNGSRVHEYAENFIKARLAKKGTPDAYDDNDQVLNGCLAFLDWVNSNEVKFVFSERLCYSKKMDIVGTADFCFTLRDEGHKILHVGDFKTGNPKKVWGKSKGEWVLKGLLPYPESRLQVSAYQGMLEEELGEKYGSKLIIYLGKENGEFTAFEIPAEEHKKDLKAFKACIEIKKRVGILEKL